jgi:diguanylate cyclase (GGDEF)-like protein
VLTRLRQSLPKKLQKWQLNCSSSSQAAILVFLFSTFSTVSIVWRWEQRRLQAERARLALIADNYANDLQRSLESSLSVTYALAALVDEYQGTIPNFKTVARDLLPLYPGTDALGILPNNAEREVVVFQGNKADAHFSSLKDFQPEAIAQRRAVGAISTKEQPILIANYSSAIGYLPVYLESDLQNSSFWGFTAVKINLAEILENIYLEDLETQGIIYQLWYTHPENNRKQIITKSDSYLISNYVEQTFEVANTTWRLSLTPVVGWNQPIQFFFQIIFCLLFSIFLAILVKLFSNNQAHTLELEKTAFDPLTGLPNRRLLLYRLEEIIARTERNSKNMAVCYLDLDSFQSINNHLGQKAGDYILVRIAKRLQKFLRKEDLVARIGGDEFVIVLQDLSEVAEVKLILKRITEAAFIPISYDTEIVSVSTSIGVVIYPLDSVEEKLSVPTLLSYAEQAMSYSKINKQESYTFFKDLKKIIAESSL